jgi:ribonuclease HII
MRVLPSIEKLLVFEKKKWDEGFSVVAGIDEAGRGPLAGPVVVAAVAFRPDVPVPEVNDSKQLSEKQRLELLEKILLTPEIQYSVVEIQAEDIDRMNILNATHEGMRRAAGNISGLAFVLIDGLPVPHFPFPSEALVKGDSRSASIAAASILAKTRRDEMMVEYASEYPEYGFENHKGYGTVAHLEALRKHGPCPIHRKSFTPVRDIISPPPEQLSLGF